MILTTIGPILLLFGPLGVAASPVDHSQVGDLSVARCGQAVHVLMDLQDTISFDSAYLVDRNGDLPADCMVEWRIELNVPQGSLANYGLEVAGSLALEDPQNGEECESSRLVLTNKEDDDDSGATSVVECGTKAVSFTTHQDIVIIQLEVATAGATGRGFELTAKSVYICGGLVTANTTSPSISTPGFPQPYAPDLFCMWSLQIPAGQTATMSCPAFSLPRRKRRRCKDLLVAVGSGSKGMKAYCGTELRAKPLSFSNGFGIINFRTTSKQQKSPGFQCHFSFQ